MLNLNSFLTKRLAAVVIDIRRILNLFARVQTYELWQINSKLLMTIASELESWVEVSDSSQEC